MIFTIVQHILFYLVHVDFLIILVMYYDLTHDRLLCCQKSRNKFWNQIGNNFFSSFYSNESHNLTLSVAPIRPCLFAITFASGYGENCVDDLEY